MFKSYKRILIIGISFLLSCGMACAALAASEFSVKKESVPNRYAFGSDKNVGTLFSGNNIVSVKSDADWTADWVLTRPENVHNGIEIESSGERSYIFYNNIVDLSKLSRNDVLFSTYVEKSERSSMSSFKVSLIDINDETNVVSVTYKASGDTGDYSATYVTVQFNGYSIALPNQEGVTTVREAGAVVMRTGFSLNEKVCEPMGFRYDAEEKAFYDWKNKLVLDLDDETILNGRTPFAGFTDNKVYLKLETPNARSCFLIQDFLGLKTDDLSMLDFGYESVLRFKYDGEYVSKTLLNDGLINVSYNLPTAITDFYFDDTISSSEKLSYLQGDVWVDISESVISGAFTPDKTGLYKVYYAIKGKKVGFIDKTVYFKILDKLPEIDIIAFDETKEILTYYPVKTYSAKGGTGKIRLSVSYNYGGEEIFPDENGNIYLDKRGSLDIKISAVDFIGNVAEKTVYVEVLPRAIITLGEVPNSYYAGQEYILPEFSATNYFYEDDETGFLMDKKIVVNGNQLNPGESYVIPEDSESLKIKFVASDPMGFYESISKEISVRVFKKSEEFNIRDYFYTENVSMDLISEGLRCTFNESCVIEFPQLLSVEKLDLSFSLIEGLYNNRFGNMHITLEDYLDPSKTVSITLTRFRGYDLADKSSTNSRIEMVLNDIYSKDFIYRTDKFNKYSEYKGLERYFINLGFSNSERIITDTSGSIITFVDYFDNGDRFNGFSDGLARVKLMIDGVRNDIGESVLLINSISNQKLNAIALASGDRQSPDIFFSKKIEIVRYGEVLTIPQIRAYDFLNGKCKVENLKLTLPDGSLVALDGNASNEMVLSQYGNYFITCDASDGVNSAEFSYNFRIKDEVAPTLEIKNAKKSFKVGDKFEMPQYVASDNVAVAETYVFIRTPDSAMKLASSEFTFTGKGEYTVFIQAYDGFSNSAYITYAISVGE